MGSLRWKVVLKRVLNNYILVKKYCSNADCSEIESNCNVEIRAADEQTVRYRIKLEFPGWEILEVSCF